MTEKSPGERLSKPPLVKYVDGYGRWLTFLLVRGLLDHNVSPGDRATPDLVADYYDELCNAGNRTTTVHGRMVELKCALAIMKPGRNFSWLTCPEGQALESTIGSDRRPRSSPDPVVLWNWGIESMLTSQAAAPRYRAVRFRDGLIIALFASRAPRVRTLATMELGRNVFLYDDGPWISFTEKDMKTKRTLEYGIPEALEPYLYRYLAVERLKLLRGRQNNSFWLTAEGRTLKTGSIPCRIIVLSREKFGDPFGPHTFRRSLGTKGVMLFPDNPGLAAAILGISRKILDAHYNVAETAVAVAKFHAVVELAASWSF